MKVSFKHVDKKYYGVNEYIVPVAKQAVKHEKFVYTVCEILNVYDKYNPHIVNDVTKALKLATFRFGENELEILNEYKILSNLLEEFYWKVVEDEDFEKQVKEDDIHMRYPDNRLGRYRGLLLEEIVGATVSERFKCNKFCTGCQIFIDRSMIEWGYGNSKHKQTIDVAGWADFVKYGEFYECKVNPKRFKNENYKYFIKLKQTLDDKGAAKYILALVSADSKNNLIAQKKALESEDTDCNIDFELLGRDDIFNILTYRIPIQDVIA